MPNKKPIIIIAVLSVLALGLGYWVGLPKEGSDGSGGGNGDPKKPEFLKEGLVAYYPFNGNAKDESGNGHDGIVNGATLTTDRFGWESQAYSFDGKNNSIKVSDHADLQLGSTGTVTLWGLARSNTGRGAFVSKDGKSYNDDFGIGINLHGKSANKLNLYFNRSPENDIPFIADTVSFSINKWVFICGAWSNAGFKLYLDGHLAGDHPATVESIASGYHLYFGETRGGAFLDGQIDDVRIYNRALSEAEVKALYEFEKAK